MIRKTLSFLVLTFIAAVGWPQVVTNPSATGISTATVTTVSCTPTQGVTCSVVNPTTDSTLLVGLGAITPTSLTTATIGGTPTITLTNASGTAASLTAGTVTTNANLTGPITSTGNTTAVAAQTGTGSTFVMQNTPALINPALGAATATSVNKVTITAPATGSTLTVADGKTLTASNTLTFTGIDGSSVSIGAGGTLPPFSGSAAYASLPTCDTDHSGYTARATDLGVTPGVRVMCNGTKWVPDGPQVIFSAAIPVGLAPSGTMANNGAVTLGTALPAAYASVYLHFPANAVVAGSAAGLYYTVMSSTTVGQVFNNLYTSGVPAAPASPTAFVTTGPGAFTASTARVTLVSLTLPGGLMGLNGSVEMESLWSVTNNANVKAPTIAFGATDTFPQSQASVIGAHDSRLITNRGSAASQVLFAGGGQGGWGTFATAHSYASNNSAADLTLKYDYTKSTATDWAGLEAFRVKVSP